MVCIACQTKKDLRDCVDCKKPICGLCEEQGRCPICVDEFENAKRPTPQALAVAFSKQMRLQNTPEELAEIRRLNTTPDYQSGCCASQNFHDANMIMLDALADLDFATQFDPAIDEDCELWNSAWDIAKASGFTL